jgi:hypothetical protein
MSPFSRRSVLSLGAVGLAGPAFAQGETGAAPAASQAQPWTLFFAGQRLWAYADRDSLLPGDRLNIMAAGGPGQAPRSVRLEVFRLGPDSPEPVWTSPFVQIGYRGATASAAAIGPGWPPAFADIDTTGWTPGCYYADLVEQVTATRDVRAAMWIVRNPHRSGRVLVRLPTNTYQAYNDWGGHSLYPNGDDERRGLIVSFDRPTPPDFFEYDAYLVAWLEGQAAKLGGVDYACNFDFHADPDLMDPYALVICGGHDEYWSGEEFTAFERRIFHQGRSVAFFGADTAYCQIRYGDLDRPPGGEARGRQLVCYKTAYDPIVRRAGAAGPDLLATRNFRHGARRPETMLLGGAYQNWFEPASDQRPAYKVARTDLPFFAGTGWTVGDVAAPVIGYEWDNRDPEADGKRLWQAGRSANAAIPEDDIKVLFRGEAVGADGQPGVAEATWYVSPAGAKVFNAGAVRWAWGLGKDGFVNPAFRRFNENLVRYMAGLA